MFTFTLISTSGSSGAEGVDVTWMVLGGAAVAPACPALSLGPLGSVMSHTTPPMGAAPRIAPAIMMPVFELASGGLEAVSATVEGVDFPIDVGLSVARR